MKTKLIPLMDLISQIGMTDLEVAFHIKVTPQSVKNWRMGTVSPILSLREPLAKLAKVNVGDVEWKLQGE